MKNGLREEILELLDKDKEFRYAIAGYLGQSEILKRMDKLEENQDKQWREVRELRREHNRLVKRFEDFIEYDFKELGRAFGMTLEYYAASFLRMHLKEKGYPEER